MDYREIAQAIADEAKRLDVTFEDVLDDVTEYGRLNCVDADDYR